MGSVTQCILDRSAAVGYFFQMDDDVHALFPSGKPDPSLIGIKVGDQYNLMVEMWDRVRARRQLSNKFYVSINSAFLSAIAAVNSIAPVNSAHSATLRLLAVAGLVICGLWFVNILYYKTLTDDKYRIIKQIEQVLPSSPFSAESEQKHRNWLFKSRHFTWVERGVAIAFGLIYVGMILVLL